MELLAAGENNFRQLVAVGHWYAEEDPGRLVNHVHLNQTNSRVRGRGSVSRLGKEGGGNEPAVFGGGGGLVGAVCFYSKNLSLSGGFGVCR